MLHDIEVSMILAAQTSNRDLFYRRCCLLGVLQNPVSTCKGKPASCTGCGQVKVHIPADSVECEWLGMSERTMRQLGASTKRTLTHDGCNNFQLSQASAGQSASNFCRCTASDLGPVPSRRPCERRSLLAVPSRLLTVVFLRLLRQTGKPTIKPPFLPSTFQVTSSCTMFFGF